MKIIKLVLSLCVITSFTFGQKKERQIVIETNEVTKTMVKAPTPPFEGKFVYTNKYKSKLSNMSNEQFTAMMGTTQEYYIKGGNYKSVTNGTLVQWQLYTNKDNKLYTKMSNSAAILWNDAAVNLDVIIKSEINKGVVELWGHKCDELVLTCKSGVQKYYYNDKIKVDPKLYANHKFANWNQVMAITKALPYKIIIDNVQFSLESVATQILPSKLDNSLFALPADAQLQKNPN